jgi:hypothetical protein
MEHSKAIHFIHHCAHWQGASAACNERNLLADPGRCHVYTEHPERYYSHQEFGRIEYYSAEYSVLLSFRKTTIRIFDYHLLRHYCVGVKLFMLFKTSS